MAAITGLGSCSTLPNQVTQPRSLRFDGAGIERVHEALDIGTGREVLASRDHDGSDLRASGLGHGLGDVGYQLSVERIHGGPIQGDQRHCPLDGVFDQAHRGPFRDTGDPTSG